MRKRNEHEIVLLFVQVDGRRARVVVAERASVLQKWRGRRLPAVGFRAVNCTVRPVLPCSICKNQGIDVGALAS